MSWRPTYQDYSSYPRLNHGYIDESYYERPRRPPGHHRSISSPGPASTCPLNACISRGFVSGNVHSTGHDSYAYVSAFRLLCLLMFAVITTFEDHTCLVVIWVVMHWAVVGRVPIGRGAIGENAMRRTIGISHMELIGGVITMQIMKSPTSPDCTRQY